MTNNGYEITHSEIFDEDKQQWEITIKKNKPANLEEVQNYISAESGLVDDLSTHLGHYSFTIDKILLTCQYELQFYKNRANLYITSVTMNVAVTDKRS